MHFDLDPGSTYEASLQRVQENNGVWESFKHENKNCPVDSVSSYMGKV
jgi:hypothetical protein